MGVQRRLFVGIAALLSAAGLAACGEEDFENNPRPPSPIELSARIGDDAVTISPAEVGAGLATITISNQTRDAAGVVLEGPTDEASDEIVAGGTGSLKLTLEEGDYDVTDDDGARTTQLIVGPERESSQNELGLP
jgi:hypothetical protein